MNKNKEFKFLEWILFVLIFSFNNSTAFARDYFVSTIGYDSNTGDINSPFKTISKAASLAVAGDQVIMRGGIYRERVKVRKSGSEGSYIVFRPYAKEKVTIDGAGVSIPYWRGLFDVINESYIKIVGLHVINSNESGIFGHGVNNIIVSNCYTYNTNSSGIGMHFGRNIIIANNEVELANTGGNQENITVDSIVNFEVSNNHVHHSGASSVGGEGIDVKGDSHHGKVFDNRVHHINRQGIYVDSFSGWLTNVEVNNNIVYSNALNGIQVGNEAGGYLENIRIFNNIVYDNEWCGINVWSGGQSDKSHGMKDIYITHNTVSKNGWTSWGSGICSNNEEAYNVVIINNIVSRNSGLQIQIAPTISRANFNIQYNLIDNSQRRWRLQGSGDTLGYHAINALPGFVDINNNNFHLKKDSPAIGNGHYAPGLPKFDFEYKSRPDHTGVSIGAFQP